MMCESSASTLQWPYTDDMLISGPRLLAHPGLNFTLIINPQNGPGSSQFPQNEYISGVQKLNSCANVQTLGYVRTGYATRNISFVLQDVATYSGWYAFNGTSLAMDGIFFDEIPSEFSGPKAEYLKTINAAAKQASGVQLDRTVSKFKRDVPKSFHAVNYHFWSEHISFGAESA
jgi:hypothetical protein